MAAVEKKKVKRISESELFALAREFEGHKKAEAAAKKSKATTQGSLIDQIKLRKVKSLESDEFGGFTRITISQASHVEYDEPGLWKAMTPTQRRESFDADLNLNALPADARKRVIESLSAEERKAVTTHRLNLDRMSQAMQKKKVPARLIAKFSKIVEHAPFITVSHGTGK